MQSLAGVPAGVLAYCEVSETANSVVAQSHLVQEEVLQWLSPEQRSRFRQGAAKRPSTILRAPTFGSLEGIAADDCDADGILDRFLCSNDFSEAATTPLERASGCPSR